MEGGMKTNPNRLVYSKAMNARSSVVQVIVRRKSDHSVRRGTGFVIQERHHALGVTSLVLTCEHVVRVNPGETGVTMWVRRALQGGGVQELPATVKAFDAFTDVALLIVPGLKGETRRPRLGLTFTASPGNVGDCAIATGYCNPKYRVTAHVRLPAISPGSMRHPRIHHVRRVHSFGKMILTLDCAAIPGMSGSPVVARGGVIGMCTDMIRDGSKRRTLAVSSDTILKNLRNWAGLHVNGGSTLNEVLARLL